MLELRFMQGRLNKIQGYLLIKFGRVKHDANKNFKVLNDQEIEGTENLVYIDLKEMHNQILIIKVSNDKGQTTKKVFVNYKDDSDVPIQLLIFLC